MKKNLLLVCFLQLLVLLFFYSDIIIGANKYLMGIEHDGMKNYFMFSYYVKHFDQLFMHKGFAYPFGEYIFKSDSHPLLAIVFGVLGTMVPFIKNHTVGVLNFIMILNPIITAGILYKIFYFLKVKSSFAIIASVGIASLSPQFLLLTVGHYSQVYSFFIPLNILLVLKLFEQKEVKYTNKILWLILIGFLIHTYIGAMLVALNMSILLVQFFFLKMNRKLLMRFLLANLLPLAVIIILFLFDPIEGRPEFKINAYHRAAFCNVFLPRYSDFHFLYDWVFDFSFQNKYKWSVKGTYIGLASNIFIISFFLLMAVKLFKKQGREFFTKFGEINFVLLSSGILVLLYSFGLPTIVDNGFILGKIPFASQIIAVERFSYVFYYVICISSVVFFYRFCNKNKFQKAFVFGIISLFLFESYAMHAYIDAKIPGRANVLSEEIFDSYYDFDEWNIDISEYDAILPIPIYIRHFLPFTRGGSYSSEELSMALSVRTGLPLMAVFLSRPSVNNSQIVLNFVENPKDSSLIETYNNKRILVVHTNEINNKYEQDLISNLDTVLFSNGKIIVSEIETNSWFKKRKEDIDN
ncbi:MAG: hypothetical protein JEZ09_15365 [Salinivirgaceae bacterium]|nr:hypothetical protein [Salinivirgaceae bacterium]